MSAASFNSLAYFDLLSSSWIFSSRSARGGRRAPSQGAFSEECDLNSYFCHMGAIVT